jgi:hypothetical protein
MIKNLLTSFLLLYFNIFTFGQSDKNVFLDGEWQIRDVRITSLTGELISDTKNNFWNKVRATEKPVIFYENNTLSLHNIGDGNQVFEIKARFEISGNEMKIYFMNGNATSIKNDGRTESIYAESYTPYEFILSADNRLILTYKDNQTFEQYTFVKN